MMSHYKKFVAKIKATTTGGMIITVECPSPIAMLDQAINMAFAQHGEAHVRAMFDKTMEREIQFKKNWDEEQLKKGATNG